MTKVRKIKIRHNEIEATDIFTPLGIGSQDKHVYEFYDIENNYE